MDDDLLVTPSLTERYERFMAKHGVDLGHRVEVDTADLIAAQVLIDHLRTTRDEALSILDRVGTSNSDRVQAAGLVLSRKEPS